MNVLYRFDFWRNEYGINNLWFKNFRPLMKFSMNFNQSQHDIRILSIISHKIYHLPTIWIMN